MKELVGKIVQKIHRTPESTPNPERARQELATMLKTWDERPDPTKLAKLVRTNNITSNTVETIAREQGLEIPDMSEVFYDLKTMLPFISQLVTKLATDNEDANLIFLGRDAGILYDVYQTKYAHRSPRFESSLLPASTDIWNSEILKHPTSDGNIDLAKQFLATYGITEERVRKGERFVIVDGGFIGNGGRRVRTLIREVFCLPEKKVTEQFPMKNIDIKGASEQNFLPIVNHFHLDSPLDEFLTSKLPRSLIASGGLTTLKEIGGAGLLYVLVKGIEALPNFHEPYSNIVERNGKVLGVPKEHTSSNDLRVVTDDAKNFVNPVAALMVEVETIRYAMGLQTTLDANP